MLKDNIKYNEQVKPNTAFLNELKDKLPEFFTADKSDDEGNIIEKGTFDLEKFQSHLKENNIEELTSGYQLDFIGKDYAKKQAGEFAKTVIVPDLEHNQLDENKDSENLFFTGDNLEVLRHLQKNYSNTIDMIYIDPPYNTGSDGFIYPDKFEYSDENLKNMFGMSDDELKRLKNIQGKATHSAWLAFIYPRLWMVKRILNSSGIIFISIDDNEMMNLKLICDEIFGERNFVSCLSIENNPKGRKNSSFVSISNEYVLIYAKDKSQSYFVENIPKKSTDMVKDEYGHYVHSSGKRVVVGENSFNNIVDDFNSKKHFSVYYNPDTQNIVLKKENDIKEVDEILLKQGYKRYISYYKNKFVENTYTEEKLKNLYNDNALDFTNEKIFEKNFSSTIRIKSMVKNEEYEAIVNNKVRKYKFDIKTTAAGTYQKELFGITDLLFSAPKSTDLIKRFITLFKKTDIIILDFFAGSGTTADAVMQLNAEDGGNRQFITVQIPEKTFTLNENGEKKAVKSSETAFNEGFMSIDEITRKRIMLSSKKIQDDGGLTLPEKFDGGFKHYYVVEPKQPVLDDLESFDLEAGLFKNSQNQLVQMPESGFDNMIKPFSAEGLSLKGKASGIDTIITTWMVSDGYKFDIEISSIEFAGYQAYYIDNNRLYLIDTNWGSKQTQELLNAIGTNKLTVQTIVIYSYSFDLESIKEIEIGLKQLDNKVNVLKRY